MCLTEMKLVPTLKMRYNFLRNIELHPFRTYFRVHFRMLWYFNPRDSFPHIFVSEMTNFSEQLLNILRFLVVSQDFCELAIATASRGLQFRQSAFAFFVPPFNTLFNNATDFLLHMSQESRTLGLDAW